MTIMWCLNCIAIVTLCCCYLMQLNDTPLHGAAGYGKVNAMKILLDHGANPNALNKVSLYLLHTHTNPDTLGTVD